MIFNLNLQEAPQGLPEEQIRRRIYTSKLESLKNQLANLLQKKIRIDLEIKRTRKKLSKLKEESKTLVKTSLQLEGVLPGPDGLIDNNLALRKLGQQSYEETLKLDLLLDEVQELLEAYADIPLYSD